MCLHEETAGGGTGGDGGELVSAVELLAHEVDCSTPEGDQTSTLHEGDCLFDHMCAKGLATQEGIGQGLRLVDGELYFGALHVSEEF